MSLPQGAVSRTADCDCGIPWSYSFAICIITCAVPEWGQGSGPHSPLKNHKSIGFLSNTGPDPLKNYKATKPAFNVGLSSARQRNAISMAFRWRVDNG